MKIRQGFVSNSSTSSFFIYGTSFEPGDFEVCAKETFFVKFKDQIEKWHKNDKYSKDTPLDKFMESISGDSYELAEIIGDVTKTFENKTFSQIEFQYPYGGDQYPYGGDYVYVGVSPNHMKDNETMGEFKERVGNALVEIFGDEVNKTKLSFIEEAWRND